MTKTCAVCGKQFTADSNRGRPKYCSDHCYFQASYARRRITLDPIPCRTCGKMIERKSSKKVYCSAACSVYATHTLPTRKHPPICTVCGGPIAQRSGLRKACSNECHKRRKAEAKQRSKNRDLASQFALLRTKIEGETRE